MSSWECPFCGHKQLLQKDNYQVSDIKLNVGKTNLGQLGLLVIAKKCLNKDCNQLSLNVEYGESEFDSFRGRDFTKTIIKTWNLLPDSSAKPQPDYIPAQIRQDYYEACKIAKDSPKASATLARRCLQGMIRDFCGISQKQLYQEIITLEKQVKEGSAPKGVDAETIEAITAIREIGNIGAHMEADINVIVDVDPDEAQVLISLIEMLFNDWYVARHKRQQGLESLKAIAADKQQQKSTPAKAIPAPVAKAKAATS